MLRNNPNERIKLEEIFNHAWITGRLLTDNFENKNVMNRRLFNVIEKEKERRAKSRSTVTCLWDKYFAEKTAKNSGKLPLIKTKNNEINETEIYEMQMKLSKKYNGKPPNYLQPIGNSKTQKNQIIKIKSLVEKSDYNTISYTDPAESITIPKRSSYMFSKTIVTKQPSKFKPTSLSASKSIAEISHAIKSVKKFNIY